MHNFDYTEDHPSQFLLLQKFGFVVKIRIMFYVAKGNKANLVHSLSKVITNKLCSVTASPGHGDIAPL